MRKEGFLFDDREIPCVSSTRSRDFESLKTPLWTEDKSRLIQEYLRLFTFVTKHGTYIDGFAAPQRRELVDLCSANKVLQTEPKWIRNFWLCDIDVEGCAILGQIAAQHVDSKRSINICNGDFNLLASDILSSSKIKSSTAAFALLDQRTFECSWDTVMLIARFKQLLAQDSNKIEIFYFLASGWLDRSIAAVRRAETEQKLERWWGRSDWRSLKGMPGVIRANLMANRFKDELGYRYAYPYAIHEKRRIGRTMYHMVHATDHQDASPLMLRAYRKVSGLGDLDLGDQIDMDELWRVAAQELDEIG